MKTRTDEPTTTRNSRKGLKPRHKPYLRTIAQGVAIGYRRKVKDGVWTASLYLGGGKYREATIGVADDVLDADGTSVLDFEQARKAVLTQVEAWKSETKARVSGGVQTVRTAVEGHVSNINAREDAQDRATRETQRRMARHVFNDPIANIPLHALTETALVDWRNRLPAHLKEATKTRVTTDLRAALNAAAKRYRATLPAELATVIRFGLAVESHSEPIARDDAALPDADIRRILASAAEIDRREDWGGDLHRMITVLAATGARFSQVMRIKVGDFQPEKQRLMMPVSRKGKGGKSSSHIPIRIGADVVSLLLPAARGRKPNEPLLLRWYREGNGRRVERRGWKTSSDVQATWRKIVANAGFPTGTVVYALRHSSIVRQLKAGLPVRLVAALHDTSTVMLEKHYSASIASMLDDVAAGAIIPLVETGETGVVVPIRG